jgi:nucleotide-binding universal stress UspA family protein
MKKNGFGRILLATDGTRHAEAAVTAAASLALASGATVRIVHVWSLEAHHHEGVWDVETRGEADKLISEAVNRLRALGVDADGAISRSDHNHVAAAIAEVARDFNADLVVAGSRGLSDWQSLLHHSVSHQLLTALDCPVLIVRGADAPAVHQAQKVLLAIAGGDDLAPGLRAATAAAAAAGSKVVVLHVAQAIIGAQGFSYVETDEEIQATIDRATTALQEAGIEHETFVAEPGAVASLVAKTAAGVGADIIVIGSSRMGDVASILFGSVTHQLLRATDRPVLVAERSRQ